MWNLFKVDNKDTRASLFLSNKGKFMPQKFDSHAQFYKRIKITKHLSRRKYLYLLWDAFRFIVVFSIFISAYRLVIQESITKKWIAKKRKYVTHDDTQANSKHAVTYRTPDIKKLNLVNSLELCKIFFIPRLFKKIYCNYYMLYLLKTWMFNEYS